MDNTVWVILAAIVVAILLIMFGNRRKKWYKVYTAQPDIMCVYRTPKDYWLGESIKDMITAHYENGNTTFIPKHWITKVDKIQEADVPIVQREIEALHKLQAEDNKE